METYNISTLKNERIKQEKKMREIDDKLPKEIIDVIYGNIAKNPEKYNGFILLDWIKLKTNHTLNLCLNTRINEEYWKRLSSNINFITILKDEFNKSKEEQNKSIFLKKMDLNSFISNTTLEGLIFAKKHNNIEIFNNYMLYVGSNKHIFLNLYDNINKKKTY